MSNLEPLVAAMIELHYVVRVLVPAVATWSSLFEIIQLSALAILSVARRLLLPLGIFVWHP